MADQKDLSIVSYSAYLTQVDMFLTVLFTIGMCLGWWLMRRPDVMVTLPNIPLWVALGVGFVVRLPRLFTPYWYDELFTSVVSALPYQQMMTVLQSDVHPPLHYLMSNRVIDWLGADYLRVPSLVAGMGVIVFSYLIAPKHKGFTALLIALLPGAIWFSAEARYPIFLAFAVVGAVWAIQNHSRWVIVFATLPAWLHATGIFYSLALAWYVRKKWWAWVIVGLSSLYMPTLLLQSRDVANGFWLQLRTPVLMFADLFAIKVGDGALIMTTLLGAVLVLTWRNQRYRLLWFGVPIILFAISVVWHPVYLTRALLPSIVLFTVFAISQSRTTLSLLGSAIAIGLMSMFTPHETTDYSAIMAQCDGADMVLATSTNMAIIARAHTDLPVAVGYDNRHQWLSTEAKNILFAPITYGDVCTVLQRSYATTDDELQLSRGELVYQFVESRWIAYEVYR